MRLLNYYIVCIYTSDPSRHLVRYTLEYCNPPNYKALTFRNYGRYMHSLGPQTHETRSEWTAK